LKEEKNTQNDFSEIVTKGHVASRGLNSGITVGIAKVILSPEDTIRLQRGEILVTTMTTPDYSIAISRAAAIVTDEGGVTCHAAIVSRELGIPCVIGTENATKLVKDGEKLKVDSNEGVIYRRGSQNEEDNLLEQ